MARLSYSIFAPRSTAALYLAWEFGIGGAHQRLARYPRDERGWIDLADSTGLKVMTARGGYTIPTRAFAERAKAKVRTVVAFQEGRLGRHLTGGTVDIQPKRAA